jgi:hypothetical protein
VFLHDRTQSKMGYYEPMEVEGVPLRCEPGAGCLDVHVKVSSTARANAAESLPEQVTGRGSQAPQGEIASQIYVFAPRARRSPASPPPRACA